MPPPPPPRVWETSISTLTALRPVRKPIAYFGLTFSSLSKHLAVTMVHQVWSPSPLGNLSEIQILGPHPISTKPKTLGQRGSSAICIFSGPPSELDICTSLRTTRLWKFCTGTTFQHPEDTIFKSPTSVGLECGPGVYISYKFPGVIDAIGLGSLF